MSCATRTLAKPILYRTPDPHGAPARFPVACGEAKPARDPYPVETALRRADALAVSLSAALHRVAPALARAAAAFVEKKAWSECGYARLEDCARERFGRTGRWVRDLAALGRAFDAMPQLEAALAGADGGRPLGQVEALLIARVATPESVEAWLRVAREGHLGKLREAIRQARAAGSVRPPGSDPVEGAVAAEADPHGRDKDGTGGDETDDDEDLDPEGRHLVRYLVPAPVAAAFDEALDLFRAVVGQEATVTSFIEALVGESLAGAEPPDLEPDGDRRPLQQGESRAVVESALARSTFNWQHLPRRADGAWGVALAGATLLKLQQLAERAGKGGPADLDDQIRALAELEDEMKRRLGRLLAEMGFGAR